MPFCFCFKNLFYFWLLIKFVMTCSYLYCYLVLRPDVSLTISVMTCQQTTSQNHHVRLLEWITLNNGGCLVIWYVLWTVVQWSQRWTVLKNYLPIKWCFGQTLIWKGDDHMPRAIFFSSLIKDKITEAPLRSAIKTNSGEI